MLQVLQVEFARRPSLERVFCTASMEQALSPFQSFAISLWALLLRFVCRTLDLIVLIPKPRLWPAYFSLWWAERRRSPYVWPRGFESVRVLQLAGQTAREAMYGEAPLFSAVWFFWKAGVGRGSQMLDIGAGRGRALLGARWLGAEARGIELLPVHVDHGAEAVRRAGARLELGDAQSAELADATHVFLNWLGMSPSTRERVVARLLTAMPGTRFLTVSIPIEHARVKTLWSRWALFTWGPARVCLQELQGE